ncbi:MAG: hypothetical protein JSV54_02520, partial [Chloroflexota bacterium]
MGFFSSPKTKIKKIDPYVGASQHMKELAETAMPGALSRVEGAGTPYPGQLTAPLSRFEEMSLGSLEDYMQSPYASQTPMYQAGAGEIEKTLGDEYD